MKDNVEKRLENGNSMIFGVPSSSKIKIKIRIDDIKRFFAYCKRRVRKGN